MPALKSQVDLPFGSILVNLSQTLQGTANRSLVTSLSLFDRFLFGLHKAFARPHSHLSHSHESIRVIANRDAPQVQDDELRPQPFCKVDRLKRIPHRSFPFGGAFGRELVAIW